MRYWIYIDNNAAGPFSEEELASQPSFSPECLVCPDGAAGGADWAAAKSRPELGSTLRSLAPRYWILDEQRTPKGPFDLKALRAYPGLKPTTFVCPVGSTHPNAWKTLDAVPELTPALTPEPAGVGAPGQAKAIDFDFPKPEGFKPPPESRAIDFDFPKPEGFKAPAGAAIDAGFPKPAGFKSPSSTRSKFNPKLAAAASAVLIAIGAAFGGYKLLAKRRKPGEASGAIPAPAAPMATQRPRTAAPEGPLQDSIDLVKTHPIAGRRAPTNLYHIGEASQKRWKAMRSVADIFRYAPFGIAWKFCQEETASRGGSPEELARRIRAKTLEWGGLDATYQVEWSAVPESGGRYRVEARVADKLSGLLRGSFAQDAPTETPGTQIEVHAFLADPAAKTVTAISPAAEADLGTTDGAALAPAAMDVPPASPRKQPRRARRSKSPKSGPAPAPAPAPATETPEAAAPEAESETASASARAPEPQDMPVTAHADPSPIRHTPDLPGMPAKPAPPTPKAAPAASTQSPSDSAKQKSTKPATEMSVDELEKYLERK